MLIVIEGPDGVGKDSVADALAEKLGGARMNFPNDNSPSGKIIRSYLKREWWLENEGELVTSQMQIMAFQALATVNRLEQIQPLREAACAINVLVLARFWQSAWVYSQLDGLDPAWIDTISMAERTLPHINVLLKAPAELCLERRASRDGALQPERYEGKLDITQKILSLYEDLWAREINIQGPVGGAWKVVDATQPLDTVVGNIYKMVKQHFA